MAARHELSEIRRSQPSVSQEKPLTYGLYGEALGFIRPAERHTNGAREAVKAQKM